MSSLTAGRALERFLDACKDALIASIRDIHSDFEDHGVEIVFTSDSELGIEWTTPDGRKLTGEEVACWSDDRNDVDGVYTVYLDNLQILHLYLKKAKAGGEEHRKVVAYYVGLPESTSLPDLEDPIAEHYTNKD